MAILTKDQIRAKLKQHPTITDLDIDARIDMIYDILTLKEKHNVVILGHNYMEPLVFNLSKPEEQGDSLGLSRYASKTTAKNIIFNGVPFMAETAKILNPEKRVFVADKTAGCSLADNFNAEQIKEMKQQYPNIPVMIYINSYAEAKAESDVCCTSANAVHIAEKMPGDKIIFVPDILFAKNLEEDMKGKKEIIYPGKNNTTKGAVCEVHEKFTLADLHAVRESFDIPKGHPTRVLYAHWECPPDVLREADFYGSTTQIRKDIVKRLEENKIERCFIASECELTANLAAEFPTVKFWTACSVRCDHMAKVTIDKVYAILKAMDENKDLSTWEVSLSPEVIEKARKPIEKMHEMSV
jgi:quinolinate synthase